MKKLNKALKLIQEANPEDMKKIVLFLFGKEHLKAMAYNHVEMILHRIKHNADNKARKELKDFLKKFSGKKKEGIEIKCNN